MPESVAMSGEYGMSEMIQRANRGVNQRDDIVGIDEDVGAIVVTFKLSNWASMKSRKENKSRKR